MRRRNQGGLWSVLLSAEHFSCTNSTDCPASLQFLVSLRFSFTEASWACAMPFCGWQEAAVGRGRQGENHLPPLDCKIQFNMQSIKQLTCLPYVFPNHSSLLSDQSVEAPGLLLPSLWNSQKLQNLNCWIQVTVRRWVLWSRKPGSYPSDFLFSTWRYCCSISTLENRWCLPKATFTSPRAGNYNPPSPAFTVFIFFPPEVPRNSQWHLLLQDCNRLLLFVQMLPFLCLQNIYSSFKKMTMFWMWNPCPRDTWPDGLWNCLKDVIGMARSLSLTKRAFCQAMFE